MIRTRFAILVYSLRIVGAEPFCETITHNEVIHLAKHINQGNTSIVGSLLTLTFVFENFIDKVLHCVGYVWVESIVL